ncbi:MAG TPA: FAD-dependent oxidoreductase [Longimicrobium sp.]|jgi:D-amino-acid oxidase
MARNYGVADALVIGAGVIGLSAAIRLQEAGMRVRVWTAAAPGETTSAVAAALWYPYRAYPAERVAVWGQRTFAELARLADHPATGVRMVPGVELWRRSVPDPEWGGAIPGLRRIPPAELPAGYADGHAVTVPVAHMGIYLGYLADRFAAGGGHLELRTVRVLGRAAHSAPLVVNCAGLGARALAGDDLVVPVRGQIVRVENPGVERFWLDEEHPGGLTYIVPRGEDCILGGTAEEGEWSTVPDPAVARAIVRRCAELEPRLAGARILEHRVGLRPGRPSVRLEAAELPGGARIIHCYGHGGAGVTLSWGCADEIAALAGHTST